MTGNSYQETYKMFLSVFNAVAPYKNRYEVFRDFVTISAISLRNSIVHNEEREKEYLQVIGTYQKKDQLEFPKLFGHLVSLLDSEPKDVLGQLYMECEFGSKHNGQFFTPDCVSRFMAQVSYGDMIDKMDKPFVTLSEPACGAGGMVLAFVKMMISHNHNPAEKLWVQCVDVDRLASLMCYVQLSLWNVPSEVIVGNSLSLEIREVWHTPAHHLGNWSYKIKNRWENEATEKSKQKSHGEDLQPIQKQASELSPENQTQFDFGF